MQGYTHGSLLADCTTGNRLLVEGCVETAAWFQKYQTIMSVLGIKGDVSRF